MRVASGQYVDIVSVLGSINSRHMQYMHVPGMYYPSVPKHKDRLYVFFLIKLVLVPKKGQRGDVSPESMKSLVFTMSS